MFMARIKFIRLKLWKINEKLTKNYDQSVAIKHKWNWPYIPDHPHRILINGASGSGKTKTLLNLIKHQR